MTILHQIIEYKKQEVSKQKKSFSIADFQDLIQEFGSKQSFYEVLNQYKQEQKMALIAEVKKASPSKGVICQDFNHIEIAKTYQKAGAAAISVLTDEKFFQGAIQYLIDVKKIVDVPVLRKDFIIDEFQIHQTAAMGADIILLIASALDKSQLKDYFDLSKELNLDVLLEVHDESEFDTALEMGAPIIGINNRNLKTFEVNLHTTVDLIKGRNLKDVFIISESGIQTSSDVNLLKNHGVSGILVGETLIKSNDIESIVISLLK